MPNLFLLFDISKKPASNFTSKPVNPITILSSKISKSEEITISSIVASSDLNDAIEEKKKFKNAA